MVPFVDLKAQYLSIKPEIDAAVLGVLSSTQFVLGKEVAAFEELFANYTNTSHALGVNTGTSALHLALLAAGIGRGDEVITTPFTFIATTSAIDYTGATPVFVDIDPQTYTIDPTKIEAAITPRTKAIVPIHLYGQPADMDPIMAIAKRHGLIVIEDACQAHGAEYKGQRVGSIGDAGCFSFYPGKNLGAYGEGGAVTTNNPGIARTVRMLRDWGAERRYHHELKGYNFRLEGMQGAVLRVKMGYIEAWTDARRTAAAYYDTLLAGSGINTPVSSPNTRHVYHIYAIRHAQRDTLQSFLHDHQIATGIHYPIPVHLQHAFAELGHKPGDFPHAEAAAIEELSLPMFPELQPVQQEQVVAALNTWMKQS
ncbi:MAG: DegT/DnrJ/EryC1/StrS family aminotransferase [Roseiflexaceae bacterium]|nr:DegT/DnrJ/EryC1/StrS family aminotransferase [Roseiflexaceae bacterium]